MTIQADCSLGFKKETTFGTYATVDRFLEHTSETLDYDREFYQGSGMRPGSRMPRSPRRILTREGGGGDIELEVPSKGLGAFLELLMGVAASNNVADDLYQQLFTPSHTDYLPAASIQKGIPRLGADTVDAYTFLGSVCSSFEFSLANAEVLKLKSSWLSREVVFDEDYETPSYAADLELFSFVGASIVAGGTVTAPTTTALASGGTEVANIRDWTISVDNGLDSGGFNVGGAGKRSRRPANGLMAVTGKLTAEYDATTFRDALADQDPLALLVTCEAVTEIETGQVATFQILLPDIRFEGELPKSNGGDVITQSLDFTAFDDLVAAEPMYIATRTADTAL